MGLACSESGNIEASVMHYRTAIALAPRHGASHNNLGVELFSMGRREEALRHANVAVEIGGTPATKGIGQRCCEAGTYNDGTGLAKPLLVFPWINLMLRECRS